MKRDSTVFVVDDDADARAALSDVLAAHEFNVETHSSGDEFLDAYDGSRPGCVVVDIHLPGTNGLDVLEALCARRTRLPGIVVTGHGEIPMVVRAVEAGAVDFLEKPCCPKQLIDSVRRGIQLDARHRVCRARYNEIERRRDLLSTQEKLVLTMLVMGMPNKAIAGQIDNSLRTVEYRRAAIVRKMDVTGVTELVALDVIRERLSHVIQENRFSFHENDDGGEICNVAACPKWLRTDASASADMHMSVQTHGKQPDDRPEW